MLLSGLPLHEDFDEAEAVYGALAGLLLNPATQQHMAGSLPAMLQVGQRCLVILVLTPTPDMFMPAVVVLLPRCSSGHIWSLLLTLPVLGFLHCVCPEDADVACLLTSCTAGAVSYLP